MDRIRNPVHPFLDFVEEVLLIFHLSSYSRSRTEHDVFRRACQDIIHMTVCQGFNSSGPTVNREKFDFVAGHFLQRHHEVAVFRLQRLKTRDVRYTELDFPGLYGAC